VNDLSGWLLSLDYRSLDNHAELKGKPFILKWERKMIEQLAGIAGRRTRAQPDPAA